MDRLTGMAVYVGVVDAHGFTAAARHLRLSTSIVSAHVRELEERLGVRLLNRTTRRLSLTDVGRLYYERCKEILAKIEETEKIASEQESAPRGLLRVTATSSFAAMHLAAALADFTELYPQISVELVTNDRSVDLIEAGLDLAFYTEPAPDSSLIGRRIVRVCTVVCGAPRYFQDHGVPLLPGDLSAHNCLTAPPLDHRWQFVDVDGHEQTVDVTGNLHSNSHQVLRAAALKGQGLICAPVFLVDEDLRQGRLVRILNHHKPKQAVIYALYPRGRHLSTKVRVFIDFLVARFEHDADWNGSNCRDVLVETPSLGENPGLHHPAHCLLSF
jgi:DNA-binding transcriptional LysR family regulator